MIRLVAGASQGQVEYGRHSPRRGNMTEARSLKVAKWTDWFNLLERRGKSGMGSGLIPQLAQNGMIGFMSRRKVRVDISADGRD